jgi:hypothetical protein
VTGCKASPPGKVERAVTTRAKHKLFVKGASAKNPLADRMSPPVPSLASKNIQSYSDGQLKWVIDNGIWPSGMPRSKGMLSDEEIWSMVLYIRHLPPVGSLGEPCIYTGGNCAASNVTPHQAMEQRLANQTQ